MQIIFNAYKMWEFELPLYLLRRRITLLGCVDLAFPAIAVVDVCFIRDGQIQK